MYNLPEFKEQDPALVLEFMRAHPFAMLIGATAAGAPVATQIPVLIDERDGKLFLSGHLMRKTDHHLAFEQNPQVLFVFTGAHSYVSASWYSEPQQGSTWNYQSVHVRGKISFLDESGLIGVMRRTSLHFEGGNTASPTVYDNLPSEYTERMLKAIVGFEVPAEDIQHVFKLSQNRDRASYRNIIGHLKQQDAGAQEVARIMQDREPNIFPGL